MVENAKPALLYIVKVLGSDKTTDGMQALKDKANEAFLRELKKNVAEEEKEDLEMKAKK